MQTGKETAAQRYFQVLRAVHKSYLQGPLTDAMVGIVDSIAQELRMGEIASALGHLLYFKQEVILSLRPAIDNYEKRHGETMARMTERKETLELIKQLYERLDDWAMVTETEQTLKSIDEVFAAAIADLDPV